MATIDAHISVEQSISHYGVAMHIYIFIFRNSTPDDFGQRVCRKKSGHACVSNQSYLRCEIECKTRVIAIRCIFLCGKLKSVFYNDVSVEDGKWNANAAAMPLCSKCCYLINLSGICYVYLEWFLILVKLYVTISANHFFVKGFPALTIIHHTIVIYFNHVDTLTHAMICKSIAIRVPHFQTNSKTLRLKNTSYHTNNINVHNRTFSLYSL